MDNQPLISVIVPVYNVEKYLPQCLDSIKNQTYKNLEIILIDDGSTDSSGVICDKVALIDKRIRVFHKENGGLSDARNYGIDKAKGSWLTFIDSDDYISSNYIEYLFKLSVTHNTKIATGAHTVFYESGKKVYKGFGKDSESVQSEKEA
ncbi:MAG: glycosyltransferase family 2 protein, partial [Treponema sp.]|uniref:glycosyltransferase family 2 protein n=1 Tax=Treponema sp. TaxID=166 RepID=UPI0025D1FD76